MILKILDKTPWIQIHKNLLSKYTLKIILSVANKNLQTDLVK